MEEKDRQSIQELTQEENAQQGVFLPSANANTGSPAPAGNEPNDCVEAPPKNGEHSKGKKEKQDRKRGENQVQKQGKKSEKKWISYVLVGILVLASFWSGFLARQLALDPEMRSLIRLKNRIEKSYYYGLDDEKFYDTIFQAINEGLLDDYSLYMDEEEYASYRAQGQGQQSGIGLVFTTRTASGEKQMYINRVCGNSPAEAVGICEGDFVVGFGATQEEMISSNDFEEFVAFLSDYGAGETFFVQFKKQGVKELFKENYVENYVFYRSNERAYRFTGENADTLTQAGEPLTCLDEKTAYIRLTHFNGGAAKQFEMAMEVFRSENKQNLVLDLRGNGGGYLDIMLEIASYFCKNTDEKTPIGVVADYGEYKKEYDVPQNVYFEYFTANSRICVLADNQSASASECLIGCMSDYGAIAYSDICLSQRDGVAKTFGKGIMQTTYPFSGKAGGAVKLTTAQICWPKSGRCIHGRGVLPEDGALQVAENQLLDAEITSAIGLLFAGN